MFVRPIFSILLICLALPSTADTITGKVIAISDGDTLTVLIDKTPYKIRLSEIDTPEKRQPYGKKAKQALSDLVFGKTISVKVETTDRYGRTVGRIYLGDLDVNAEMVRNGHAWVYQKYAKDKNLYQLEVIAKENEVGLWSLPEAQKIPPWEWRRGKREMSVKEVATFKCGAKRYCKQMANCNEAVFYLNKCGLSRLDGDKDGIPCESLCR